MLNSTKGFDDIIISNSEKIEPIFSNPISDACKSMKTLTESIENTGLKKVSFLKEEVNILPHRIVIYD